MGHQRVCPTNPKEGAAPPCLTPFDHEPRCWRAGESFPPCASYGPPRLRNPNDAEEGRLLLAAGRGANAPRPGSRCCGPPKGSIGPRRFALRSVDVQRATQPAAGGSRWVVATPGASVASRRLARHHNASSVGYAQEKGGAPSSRPPWISAASPPQQTKPPSPCPWSRRGFACGPKRRRPRWRLGVRFCREIVAARPRI